MTSVVLLSFILVSHFSCKEKAISDNESISICFTGDVLLDRGVRKEIERTRDINSLFRGVNMLFKNSDAVVINLECPITDKIAPINKKFIFRGNAEWAKALYDNGVTHAALANNHTMDQGRSGLVDTYNNLVKYDVKVLGYGDSQSSACQPVFIKKNNIEVALFNSVLVPLENWMYLDDEPGVCQASIDELSNAIATLKKEKPQSYIVAVLHWGAEYHLTPDLIQRKDAHRLIDNGADAIIGHHPHVIQGEEIYNEKPIFYSLGNFIFDQSKPHTDVGLAVNLIFGEKGMSFEKRIIKIEACTPKLTTSLNLK